MSSWRALRSTFEDWILYKLIFIASKFWSQKRQKNQQNNMEQIGIRTEWAELSRAELRLYVEISLSHQFYIKPQIEDLNRFVRHSFSCAIVFNFSNLISTGNAIASWFFHSLLLCLVVPFGSFNAIKPFSGAFIYDYCHCYYLKWTIFFSFWTWNRSIFGFKCISINTVILEDNKREQRNWLDDR